MSKLTKLITKPDKFFIDMFKKRDPINRIKKNAVKNEKALVFKATPSLVSGQLKDKVNTRTPIAKKNITTMITDNIRLFNKTAHLLHTGEGIKCAFHLELWLGEFIASKESFAILIRNLELYEWAIQQYPYLDIVYAKTALDVESILSKLPYLRGVYYFSNTGNLIHTLRFNSYQHIFLGHGDSDKAASAHKFFRVYDEIWVAGQAHIDRFKNTGFNTDHIKFVKVGRPTLKHIVRKSLNNSKKDCAINNLTYFPTWEGAFEENNYSSAHLSIVMLSEIQKILNCNIRAKYHPLTGQRDKTFESVTVSLEREFIDRQYLLNIADKTVPVSNLIIDSQAFICDISAVVSECISSLSPIFIYIPSDRKVVTSSSDMSYSDYAYIFSSIPELISLITEVLINGNDYLAKARYRALDYLLSIHETVNDEFQLQLKRMSSKISLQENTRPLLA